MYSLTKISRFAIISAVLLSIGWLFRAEAQTLGGIPGLIRIPTADFMRDGSFYLGGGFFPKEALDYTGHQHDGLTLFSSLTFLPFFELDLRLTRQLNLPAEATHTVDRSPGIRLQLLKQTGYLPSAALGLQDLFSTISDGEARHFAASYLVLTRGFAAGALYLSPTLGYSYPMLASRQNEFVGWFGGLRVQPRSFTSLAFLLEYDTHNTNIGFDFIIRHFVLLKFALLNFQYFSFGSSMHFDLFAVFKN
jgi:hypothetical protein